MNVSSNVEVDLDLAMQTAKAAAIAASAASLVFFCQGVRVETKPDRSPVTQADREAEAAIFGIIRTNFPDHALLGEETGEHAGRAEVCIEAGVKSWDLGPFPVLVAEAGGRYTDFNGNENVHSGHCVVSNAKLHAHVFSALK